MAVKTGKNTPARVKGGRPTICGARTRCRQVRARALEQSYSSHNLRIPPSPPRRSKLRSTHHPPIASRRGIFRTATFAPPFPHKATLGLLFIIHQNGIRASRLHDGDTPRGAVFIELRRLLASRGGSRQATVSCAPARVRRSSRASAAAYWLHAERRGKRVPQRRGHTDDAVLGPARTP